MDDRNTAQTVPTANDITAAIYIFSETRAQTQTVIDILKAAGFTTKVDPDQDQPAHSTRCYLSIKPEQYRKWLPAIYPRRNRAEQQNRPIIRHIIPPANADQIEQYLFAHENDIAAGTNGLADLAPVFQHFFGRPARTPKPQNPTNETANPKHA